MILITKITIQSPMTENRYEEEANITSEKKCFNLGKMQNDKLRSAQKTMASVRASKKNKIN